MFLFLILHPGMATGYSEEGDVLAIKRELANDGFLDVNCLITEDYSVLVSFENDPYRFEATAISRVLEIVYALVSSNNYSRIILIVNKLQIPIVQIEAPIKVIDQYKSGAISASEFKNQIVISFRTKSARLLSKGNKVNSSAGNVDLVLKPKLGLNLGAYDYPFRYLFNLNPLLKVKLWKGAYFAPEFNLPLFDFKLDLKYNYARLENLALTQFLKLEGSTFLRLSAGLFNGRRYGGEFEIGKYFINGKLFVRTKIACTGSAIYLNKGVSGVNNTKYEKDVWEIAPISYFNHYSSIEYRFPTYNLAVNLGYGKYLFENNVWNVLVYRHFNEYLLGFNAFVSETGRNYGFVVQIPLSPGKYIVNTKINVKPSRFIKYSYLATTDYVDSFEAGLSVNDLILDLNPSLLKNYLAIELFKGIRN